MIVEEGRDHRCCAWIVCAEQTLKIESLCRKLITSVFRPNEGRCRQVGFIRKIETSQKRVIRCQFSFEPPTPVLINLKVTVRKETPAKGLC